MPSRSRLDGEAAPARRTRRRTAAFYAPALDQADRTDLMDAGAVAGLDQEIAVLRLRLRRLLREQPDDFALMIRTTELLVRAVGTTARLASDDADAALARVSDNLRDVVSLFMEPTAPSEPAQAGASLEGPDDPHPATSTDALAPERTA